MDEDVAIINTNTRNEKIKNFFVNNKKKIIILTSIIILFLISFFGFKEFQNKKKINISNLYNTAVIGYTEDTKNKSKDILLNIIYKKDPTYSPLSLYFIIDNKLIINQKKMNELFDIVINNHNEIILLSFKDCLVTFNDSNQESMVLFDPSWGVFDLLIGSEIISAYPGPADRTAFPFEKQHLKTETIHINISEKEQILNQLYMTVRDMRETHINRDKLSSVLRQLINEFQNDWLLSLEICELSKDKYEDIYKLASKIILEYEFLQAYLDG